MEIVIWIAVSILAIIVDLFTSAFMFSWICIGSIVAIICNLLGCDMGIQIIAFSITSVISIAIGYNLVTKRIKKSIKRVPLMEETFIGSTYTAVNDIGQNAMIKVEGTYWTGQNLGERILRGQKFKITGINGNKLLIKKC